MITEEEIKSMVDEITDKLGDGNYNGWGIAISFCNLNSGSSFGLFYGQEDNLGATLAGALISKPEMISLFETAIKVAKESIRENTIMLDDFVNNNNNKIKS